MHLTSDSCLSTWVGDGHMLVLYVDVDMDVVHPHYPSTCHWWLTCMHKTVKITTAKMKLQETIMSTDR